MRTANIIRKFATAKSTATASARTSAISSNSIRIPSFRTFASQHWSCFRGCGLLNFSPSISAFKAMSGSSSPVRLARLQSTAFTTSRNFFGTSILEARTLKSNWKQRNERCANADPDVKELIRSMNKKIFQLGNGGLWREILKLYQEQKQDFRAANHATVMSELASIRPMRTNDPLFETFLADTNAKIQLFGIKWLGDAPTLSTIVHAIAKMRLDPKRNGTARQIMSFAGDKKTLLWLFENGDSLSISNCVWAFAKLGIKSPDLFQMLDRRADW